MKDSQILPNCVINDPLEYKVFTSQSNFVNIKSPEDFLGEEIWFTFQSTEYSNIVANIRSHKTYDLSKVEGLDDIRKGMVTLKLLRNEQFDLYIGPSQSLFVPEEDPRELVVLNKNIIYGIEQYDFVF